MSVSQGQPGLPNKILSQNSKKQCLAKIFVNLTSQSYLGKGLLIEKMPL